MLNVVLLALLLVQEMDAPHRDGPPILRPGDVIEGVIEDGDPIVETPALLDGGDTTEHPVLGKTWRIEVDQPGTYHVDLRSWLFDAYLLIRDADGAVLGEDNDGLINLHSRIVIDLSPGQTPTVTACALHGGRGTFELTLGAGTPAPLDDAVRARIELQDAERRVEVVSAARGPEHPDTATSLNAFASLLRAQGDLSSARSVLERTLAIREAALGPEHPETATSLNNLGTVLGEQGDVSAALPLLERALSIREATLGREHPETGNILQNLGFLRWAQGDLSAARPLLERSLAIREVALGPDHPDTASSLHALASLLRAQGNLPAARPLLERTVSIREVALGPDHPETGTSLNNLGAVLFEQGDVSAARPLLERALAITEATLGPDHPETANILQNLGDLLHDQGELSSARPLLERAVSIYEAALGPDHPTTGTSLSRLGSLLHDQGELSAARQLLERTLAIREEALGPRHPETVTSLNDLGTLLHDLGDLSAARRLYERALAISEEAPGPDHPETGTSLNNLGILLHDQGDLSAARRLYERALAISEDALGPEHPQTGSCLNSLGTLLHDLGDLSAARPLLERSLAISEQVFGAEHPRTAGSLNNLGTLLYQQGDVAAARALVERSLAISEQVFGAEHPRTAASLQNLGHLARAEGDLAAARPLYERALAIWEEALGPEHPWTAACLNDLALVLLDARSPAEAVTLARRAAEHRGLLRRYLASQVEGAAFRYLETLRWQRDTLLSAASAADATPLAHAAVLRSKGEVASLTLQTRVQLRAGLDPEVVALSDRLADLQARLSFLAYETDVRNREAHENLMTEVRREREAVERALRERADVIEPLEVTSADVAAALPAGAAFVDLLVHRVWLPAQFDDEAGVLERGRWSDPRVSAWVVHASEHGRGTRAVTHVDLGPAAAIESACRRFLDSIVTQRGVSVVATGEAPGVKLRQLVWDPLAGVLGDVSTVFLSPDGVLAKVPFGTLHDGEGRHLIERYDFVYTTHAASLVEQLEVVDETEPTRNRVLAVGGVDYGRRDRPQDEALEAASGVHEVATPAEPTLRRSFQRYWQPLDATRAEARFVASIFEDLGGVDAEALLLQGAAATENRLKAEMPEHDVLHLATHGYFQPEGLPSMRASARRLVAEEQEQGWRTTNTARAVTGLHPGLLSGLVLAGANAAADEGTLDDGYLTASEVSVLDLAGVELVVLSACETGLGRPQSGEGLLGLRRAFHIAGADTVISTLWSVQDDSTSNLMRSFYANLLVDDMGRYEALREAQLEMLRRNRAEYGDGRPGTWGAFVLSGEWR